MKLEQNSSDSDALSEIGEFYRKAVFGSQAEEFHARAEKAKREAKATIPRDEAQRQADPPTGGPRNALIGQAQIASKGLRIPITGAFNK